ncbi:hypothetical protein C8Q77DRAFT_1155122 [Trametes polyzona]|nr:hypothetical protein C8Q77DRAFT_1155122 [Trametes polyzona]
MLLTHTVLAVVYGGLLASARVPEWDHAEAYADAVDPTGGRNVYAQDDFVEASPNPLRHRSGAWEWVPGAPQTVMDVHFESSGTEHHGGPQHPVPPPPDEPEAPRPGHRWGAFPGPPGGHPNWPGVPPDPRPPKPGHPEDPQGHPHHPPPDWSNLTIYQFLESHKEFSRLLKVINYTDDITGLLNDTSANLTFFATPDWALPQPPKRDPRRGDDDAEYAFDSDYLDTLAAAEGLAQVDSHDDKDRKAIFKAILKAILKYETLPKALPVVELGKNVTYATSLTLPDGSLDGEPLRVRVGARPGLRSPVNVDVNVVSRVVWGDIKTKNGLIHVVNHPVLPPPSSFQLGFFFTEQFSVLTSALQRVGLTGDIEWREVPNADGKHTVDGSPAVTFFAPTNKAFARLPKRLKFFLFSPLGEKVLKKLLQFHVVPEVVLHADYLHNASESDAAHKRRVWEGDMSWNAMQSNSEVLAHFEGAITSPPPLRGAEPVPRGHGACSRVQHSGPQPQPQYQQGPPPHFPAPGPHHPGPVPPPPPPPPPPHYPRHGDGPHFPHLPPPPPPQIHYHYHFSPPPPHHGHEGPHHPPPFPPHFPGDGPHFPEHEGPHFPPHGPHFPPHGPHFPPPPPPGHPPFEHGPHPPQHAPLPPPPPGDGPHGPPHEWPGHKVVYSRNITIPTLFADHPVNVHVAQHEITFGHGPFARTFYQTVTHAHGVPVVLSDIPTRNGVLHIVDRLLNPLRKPGHVPPGAPPGDEHPPLFESADSEDPEAEWEGWEDWLIRWADEE